MLALGRHRWRCHEARRVHGRERLSPRNGLVHSSKLTKPRVILPPSISSALCASLTMSLRYASMSCTLLGCLFATIAMYVVKHCTHVGSCSTCRARLPTAITASPRDVPSSCRRISMLSCNKSAIFTNSKRFTPKRWTCLASGCGDFVCSLRPLLGVKQGHVLQRHAGGISPSTVSLPAHQGLSSCGTELNYNAYARTTRSVSTQYHFRSSFSSKSKHCFFFILD